MADRLVPVIHTPVEDIIYEVLDQKGLPTRTEVRDLRNKLDRLEKTISELTKALEGLQDEVDKVGSSAEQLLTQRPGTGTKKGTKASKASKASKARDPGSRSRKTDPAQRICKKDDCDGKVRAKGFCGKHYQKYKRGTLEGWVCEDGSTTHGEVRYMVDKKAAGQAVETRYDGDEVIFLLPESGGKTLRVHVNKVRID